MGFQWKKLGQVGKIALAVVGASVPAVNKVAQIGEVLFAGGKPLTDQEKQTMALEFIKASIESAEGVSGRDLFYDPAVEQASRDVIDAIWAFQKVLNHATQTPVTASGAATTNN